MKWRDPIPQVVMRRAWLAQNISQAVAATNDENLLSINAIWRKLIPNEHRRHVFVHDFFVGWFDHVLYFGNDFARTLGRNCRRMWEKDHGQEKEEASGQEVSPVRDQVHVLELR